MLCSVKGENMTVSIGIKVNDGFVIASDSAITVGNAQSVMNVYNNGSKIFNIHRELPIGVSFWGLAAIQGHSVDFWMKEIRKDFEGLSNKDSLPVIDKSTYELQTIAFQICTFIHGLMAEQIKNTSVELSEIGVLVAGYSSNGRDPESFIFHTNDIELKVPEIAITQTTGIVAHGQPELIHRVVTGVTQQIGNALQQLGVKEDQIPGYVNAIKAQTFTPLISDSMPIQDAVDLSRFLAEATVQFIRFSNGANTVDGPIEIASITRHEGFKWIQRKHYYPIELNGGRNE
jgi:hypothetical protein